MGGRGSLFQGILTFQMLVMENLIFGIIYDIPSICIVCLFAWGLSVFAAQDSYSNLIKRIEDLEKKKEDDENGD